MDLGEKLRQARLAAGLSQRQLCGQEITRNMLSQIESGKARPSMSTLQYLAARLEKPVSYFLEEEMTASPNQTVMETARQAYLAQAFQTALDALVRYREPDALLDGEKSLLEMLCLTELGRQVLSQEKLPYARQLLEKAGTLQCPYWTPALERERLILLAQAGVDVDVAADDRVLLLQARRALGAGDGRQAAQYLDAAADRDAQWHLLRGRCAMAAGEYPAAAALVHRAEQALPEETAPLWEQCYRELEDYKMAYHYAYLQKNG